MFLASPVSQSIMEARPPFSCHPLAYPALAVFQPLCEYPIYPAPSFQLFNGLFIYFVYMHVSGCVLRSMCGGLLGVSALLPP